MFPLTKFTELQPLFFMPIALTCVWCPLRFVTGPRKHPSPPVSISG